MSGFLDKVSGIFFREEDDLPEDHYIAKNEERAPIAMPNERSLWNEREGGRHKKNNILAIPNRESAMEMVLIKAASYDDLQEIAGHIKDRRVVVVNFEDMDKDTAQRMVDFLSGAVFSLDGQPKKVSGGTFIFSSSNVDLSGQIMEGDGPVPDGEEGKASFKNYPWLKHK